MNTLKQLAKIPVRIDNSLYFFLGSFLILDLIFGKSVQTTILSLFAMVVLYLSVLVHEYAHAFVGIKQKRSVKRIIISFLGGAALFNDDLPKTMKTFWLYAAGPISNIILATLFLGTAILFIGNESVAMFLLTAMTLNIAVAVFNLLPAFPLDGGWMLRLILLKYLKDDIKAMKVLVVIQLLTLIPIVIVLLKLKLILGIIIVLILPLFTYGEYRDTVQNTNNNLNLQNND